MLGRASTTSTVRCNNCDVQASESCKALEQARQQLIAAKKDAILCHADSQSKLQQLQQDSKSQMQCAAKQLEQKTADMLSKETSLTEELVRLQTEKDASDKLLADSSTEMEHLKLQIAEAGGLCP